MKTQSTVVVLLCAYAMFAFASPIPPQEDAWEMNVFPEETLVTKGFVQEAKVALSEAGIQHHFGSTSELLARLRLAAKYEDTNHVKEERRLVRAFKKWGNIKTLMDEPEYDELLEDEQPPPPKWAQKIIAMHRPRRAEDNEDEIVTKVLEDVRAKLNEDINFCAGVRASKDKGTWAFKDIPEDYQVMKVDIPKGALRMGIAAGTDISLHGLQATSKNGKVMELNIQMSRRLSPYPLHDARRTFTVESLEPSPCEAQSWIDAGTVGQLKVAEEKEPRPEELYVDESLITEAPKKDDATPQECSWKSKSGQDCLAKCKTAGAGCTLQDAPHAPKQARGSVAIKIARHGT